MIIDVISFFPFDLVTGDDATSTASASNHSGDSMENLAKLLRIPRLYRLLRIIRIFKILNYCKKSDMMDKVQEFFGVKQGLAKLITFLITILICVHVISCM